MASPKTEIVLTLNGQAVLSVLEEMRKYAAAVKKEMDGLDVASKEYKELRQKYDALNSARESTIKSTERLNHAVQNLANTSLQNLRRALGDGKRSLESLTEAQIEQANQIREKMRLVGNQLRLLSGEYVKISEGLTKLSSQSDAWLSKAIKQQNETLLVTERGSDAYREQTKVLRTLTNEQNRRAAAAKAEAEAERQTLFKGQVASSRRMLSSKETMQGFSSTELQTSLNILRQAQSQVKMGSDEWRTYGEEIARAEKNLAELSGKLKEVKQGMTKVEAEGILQNVGGHSEKEIREAISLMKLLQSEVQVGGDEWKAYASKIDTAENELAQLTNRAKEVKQALSTDEMTVRLNNLNTQSEQSLKEMLNYLEQAKAQMIPFEDSWHRVAQQIAMVNQRMEEVRNPKPYAKNFFSANNIAFDKELTLADGSKHAITSNDLQWAKGYLQKELNETSVGDTRRIEGIKHALSAIEEKLKAVSNAGEEATMSAEKLENVLSDMKSASLNELKQASVTLRNKLEFLPPSAEEAQELRKKLVLLDREIKQVGDDAVNVNDVIEKHKKGQASVQELRKAYEQLKKELETISTGDEDFNKKRQQIDQLRSSIERVTGAVNRQGGAWQTALRNLTAYAGLFEIFNRVKTLITGVVQKNFEYSGSLTDIRKVAGFTNKEIVALSKNLALIDTRTTTDELAQIAYEGAKLGMSNFGVEGMAGFVRAADQIKVAIGEEMGEGALPALSKMVEVMGLIPKMGIEQSMLATGSAMFKLSSSSTATSTNIVEFAKRLTGVSRTAGITIDQLLALGSASDAMMLMPEVASTAMSKLIVSLQKNHNLIEKDLGLQKGVINSYYEQGRAMEAVVLILERAKKIGNMNALGDIFKDFGSDGQQLISSVVTMAKNVDMLKDHLDIANEAFEEGTAVTAEYKMQQDSAIGILERANNLWTKAFVNPKGVDNVKAFAEVWYEVSRALTSNTAAVGSLNFLFQVMLFLLKGVMILLPGLVAGFMFKGVSAVVLSVKNALLGMGEASLWAAIKARSLTSAIRGMNAAMKANWISVLIGLLVELGVAIYDFFKGTEEATEKQKTLNDYVREGSAEWDRERRKLDSYVRALEDSNISSERRVDILRKFNREYRPYLEKLGIEVNSVDTLKKHYALLNEEISKKMFYQMRESAYKDRLDPIQKDIGSTLMDYSKFINSKEGSSFKAFGTDYVVDLIYKGFKPNDIVRSMLPQGANLKKNVDAGRQSKTGNRKGSENPYNILDTARNKAYQYVEKPNVDAKTEAKIYQLVSKLYEGEKRRISTKENIDKTFNPLVRDYTPWYDEELGTLSNDAPDKDEIAEEKRVAREVAKDRREQLKEAQDEANAIIDNVGNYFDRQINAKLAKAIEDGLSETEREFEIEPLKKAKNDALSQVRLAIAGKKNSWNDILNGLSGIKAEKDDETGFNMSDSLLSDIEKVNIGSLRQKMLTLSSGLKLPFNSVIAQIFAKATRNQQDNLNTEIRQRDARKKAAEEQDFLGLVKNKNYEDFNKLGYANPSAAELADRNKFEARRMRIFQMFETARQQIDGLSALNMGEAADRGKLMTLLFGDDPDKFGAQISEVLKNSEEDWRAFYYKLIQYANEYGEAVDKYRKRGVDLFDDTTTGPDGSKSETRESQLISRYVSIQKALGGLRYDKETGTAKTISFGKGMAMSMGLTSNEEDPEIAQLRLKYEKELALYEKFKEMYQNDVNMQGEIQRRKKELFDAGLAYTEKVSASQQEQANNLFNLLAPVQQFGWSVGEAFATMTQDAKEGKKQVKAALKAMANSFAQSTLEIIKQNLMRQMNTQITYGNIETMSKTHGVAMVSAEQTKNTELSAAQQIHDTESIAQQAATTTAKTQLSLAEAIAKCFGELGPIGGPIAMAGVMAVISGALSFALNAALGGKNKDAKNIKTVNSKIVSGMLTYDSGNVQELKPYVARTGEVYWAADDDGKNISGVRMLSTPTATTINGQAALVAENGPEIVIGRETTQAMMMNAPTLLKALVNFDRNYSGRRAFDTGNVGETIGKNAPINSISDGLIAESAASNAALLQAISVLLKRLEQPIQAKIDMYGRGNLYESMNKANNFMKNKS